MHNPPMYHMSTERLEALHTICSVRRTNSQISHFENNNSQRSFPKIRLAVPNVLVSWDCHHEDKIDSHNEYHDIPGHKRTRESCVLDPTSVRSAPVFCVLMSISSDTRV